MKIKEYKINANFSGAVITLDWDHGMIKCLSEDRIYYVIEWEWVCEINGVQYSISAEDIIYLPQDTPYNIVGKLKYLLICSPEFDPQHDIPLS